MSPLRSLLALLLAAAAVGAAAGEARRCVRVASSMPHFTIKEGEDQEEPDSATESADNIQFVSDDDDGNSSSLSAAATYVECPSQSMHCFAFWQDSPTDNETVILGKGCWESSGKSPDCEKNECVADKRRQKTANNTKFCCCSSDFCNINVSYIPSSAEPEVAVLTIEAEPERPTAIIVFIASFTILFVCLLCFLIMRNWDTKATNTNISDCSQLMLGYTSGQYSFDHLSLSNIIGQGRYGTVWRARVNDQDVAVKIFPAHHKNYFYNEKDIYTLPFMDNCSALLAYFGCDERLTMEGNVEYLLVLSYAPEGCLQDHLRNNILDFHVFWKMAQSVAKGLAHLHTDLVKGDKSKPCVVHRDLNSRNILVKSDQTCCICDLGFAMKITGSTYYYNGGEQHAETKSINEVGTLRYMAPEVLEGAVNLRDCETSLKQIDVYALGLVLWELGTRCVDFYNANAELPPYKLPFQDEIGLHPSLEQMQGLVSRHKARPLFPANWKESQAVRMVRDTIEDCWDQDAEARLTALCVEERLNELPSLKERHKGNIYPLSPTLNSTQSLANIKNNNQSVTVNFNQCDINEVCNENLTGASQGYSYSKTDNSEGTVETLLSPSEPTENNCKNSNERVPYFFTRPAPIQPYQGRNPCLERNLMSQEQLADQDSPDGRRLIDKSLKQLSSHRRGPADHQNLVSHELGVANRPITPIPYVQNVVSSGSDAGRAYGKPKQLNVSANSSSSGGQSPRPKAVWDRLLRVLFGARAESSGDDCSESNLIPEDALVGRRTEMVETQVNLVGGKFVNAAVKTSVVNEEKPTNGRRQQLSLPLAGDADADRAAAARNDGEDEEQQQRQLEEEEDEEADEENTDRPQSTSGIAQIMRLNPHAPLDHFNEVFRSHSDLSQMKDPSERIKTPGDVPEAVRRARGKTNSYRMSLYDDRMMMLGEGGAPGSGAGGEGFSSVPDDMHCITIETEEERPLHNSDSASSF